MSGSGFVFDEGMVKGLYWNGCLFWKIMHLDFILRELGFLVFHIFQFEQDYVVWIKNARWNSSPFHVQKQRSSAKETSPTKVGFYVWRKFWREIIVHEKNCLKWGIFWIDLLVTHDDSYLSMWRWMQRFRTDCRLRNRALQGDKVLEPVMVHPWIQHESRTGTIN